MAKIKNKEQEDYNKERIVDIVLVIGYMKTLNIDNDYFTEKGKGFLDGLASQKDELKFISKDYYNKIHNKAEELVKTVENEIVNVRKENKEIKLKYNDLLREYNNLKNKRWYEIW